MSSSSSPETPTEVDVSKYPDRVSAMFSGSTILITGASGFLGKVLLEKLLRDTQARLIYIIVRTKKGKTPKERLSDILQNPLFNVLRETNPSAFNRVQIVGGDMTAPDLAISPEDRKKLRDEVEFIYHSAATTRFDDTMKYAVTMNTRGTKLMLDLAKECKKLKCFVHVSTAYVCPKEEVLYEKSYPSPANPHEVLNSINWINEDTMGNFTKELLRDTPNTYTFTKALAEALVVEQMDKMPVIVVRPSVVIPTLKQPIPGWCNNLQGPMGLFVGAGKGIIRSMYMPSNSYADFLPADICINGMIGATWDYMTLKKNRFFNLVSGKFYKLSWQEIIDLGRYVIENKMPFNQVVWYPGGSMKSSRLYHNVCFYLFQIIPALFIDLLLMVLGYKPVLYGIQRRIQKGSEMFEYYTWKAWKFDNSVLLAITERLNPREKVVYHDGKDVDLIDYLTDCIHSVRKYNLKETDDMLPAARRNMKIMWVLDKLVKTLFIVGMLYYMYKIFFLPKSLTVS